MPAEKWTKMRTVFFVKEFHELCITGFTKRNPSSPNERFVVPVDRNLNASPNVEFSLIDHAIVTTQVNPGTTFLLGNVENCNRVVGTEGRDA